MMRLLAMFLDWLIDKPAPPRPPILSATAKPETTLDEYADRAISIVANSHVDRALGYCGPDCALCAGVDLDALIDSVNEQIAAIPPRLRSVKR